MPFNAALLLPHPSLHQPHPSRQRRIQRQPSKLALFRLYRRRRVDVIQEDPPSLEPLQFPKEPTIDLTTCLGHWVKQENSTLARNEAENDDHNTPNLNQSVFLNLPQSLTGSTTQKPDQLPNNNEKSSCAFTNPIDHISPPSSAAEYLKRSQSDCGHEYTHQPRVQQKLQKSSSLLRSFSLSARSRHSIYSHYTQQAERDAPTTRSHLSPSPAPPSSCSRVGSAISLNPSSSAEPSPTPSRNTSSRSLSRRKFWRGSAPSWKGKAREEYDDDYEENQTTWEAIAVNRSEEVKRSNVCVSQSLSLIYNANASCIPTLKLFQLGCGEHAFNLYIFLKTSCSLQISRCVFNGFRTAADSHSSLPNFTSTLHDILIKIPSSRW
ncbi:hypothetical protein BJ165DRAFT_857168 [Panaeolus papilionaceus]|nr:hypothetical protein BJ165DRAFT_857168 [Panaeolus papilionaceus]